MNKELIVLMEQVVVVQVVVKIIELVVQMEVME
jgi:hypothetical protein